MTRRDPSGGPDETGPDSGSSSADEPGPGSDGGGEPGRRGGGAAIPASAGASRPGATIFTIEGRAAPGLFVVGWLATVMGGAIVAAGFLSAGAAAVGLVLTGLVALAIGLVAGAGSQAIERRARGVPGYAGPAPVLVFAAVVVVAILLEVAAGVPLSAAGVDPGSPLAFLIGIVVMAVASLGLVRLLVVGTGALSWREMGVRPPGGRQLTELAIGALMAFPVIVINELIAAVLATFLAPPASTLPLTGGAGGMLLNLVSAVVVAPIAEETFFRGFATTAWLRGAGANAAIARGALLFAAAHILTIGADTFAVGFERALFAFLARLPVAIALGWVFVRSRSLYASIGLHAVFNGIPFLVLLLIGRP